jgi:hypothetical protein
MVPTHNMHRNPTAARNTYKYVLASTKQCKTPNKTLPCGGLFYPKL